MRYKSPPYSLGVIQRIDAMKKNEELRCYSNKVMVALTVLLKRAGEQTPTPEADWHSLACTHNEVWRFFVL